MTQGGFTVDTRVIAQHASTVRARGEDVSEVANNVSGATIGGDALGKIGEQTASQVQQAISQAQQAVNSASQSLQSQSGSLSRTAVNYTQTDEDGAQKFTKVESTIR
ncbi:MAG TPA: type VII secretion target [Pseudonocardiaceae bacterium]|jgi:hypothetical protein|nr:type VII secretion target [Pseudonocardiaceae bacterium]